MDLQVVPLHHNKRYTIQCCQLINDEWKRSETARIRSLDCSCDELPTSLILLQNNQLLGHLKLSPIPSIKSGCFIESVVIQRGLRGKGYGRILMEKAEDYCKEFLRLEFIYLSTRGQEGFYTKLGYQECPAISIYGCYTPTNIDRVCNNISVEAKMAPKPPPLPLFNVNSNLKTFMRKQLQN